MKAKSLPYLSLATGQLRRARSRSSALIIVLACMVFISVLIIAFFTSVTTERTAAKYYANASSVKLLADSTVSVVMGQIMNATKGADGNGNTLAWASQPGMIRTYDTTGQASGYYKLYSWTNMIGAGPFNPFSTTEAPPTDWYKYPSLYTDLNEPGSGSVYPIVDPTATNTLNTGTIYGNFPANAVVGFSISNSAPVTPTDGAPMPVQWLYVLRDGSLASPSIAGSTNIVDVPGASSGNPIVGRIAFWADDDTSKININTASGSTWATNTALGVSSVPTKPIQSFWDTPRMNGYYESNYMAMAQPTHNEFQRYPGHPATTFVSAVFSGFNMLGGTNSQSWAINPRVNYGGSYDGTNSIVTSTPVIQKTDRLYASVDELLLSPSLSGTTRLSNSLFNQYGLNNVALQRANFFLTAHSRAPEVNLFNQPRIITWPVSVNTTSAYRTAYDSLIAFDGSLAATNAGSFMTNAYYFQRSDSISATTDLPAAPAATGLGRNRALMQYLQYLTAQPVPGFSTSSTDTFLNKYPGVGGVTDRDQILTEIFDYVRALDSQDVTGRAQGMTNTFTPTFTSLVNYNQMASQAGQITPIYDTVTKTRGFGRFPTITEADLIFSGIGMTTTNNIAPPALGITNFPPYATNYPGYAGGGSFHAGSASVSPYVETWSPPSQNGTNYYSVGASYTNCAPGYTKIQPYFLGNLFIPTAGFASIQQDYYVEVDNLSSFNWTDSDGKSYPMFRQDSTTNNIYGAYSELGGYVGIQNFTCAGNYFGPVSHGNTDLYQYNTGQTLGANGFANYGNTLDVRSGATFGFTGGTAIIKFRAPIINGYSNYAGSPYYPNPGPAGPVIQQITIAFPPQPNIPVPGLAPKVLDGNFLGTNPVVINDFRDVPQHFSGGTAPQNAWITDKDVVRSMVLDATKADARTVMAMTNVSSAFYIAGPNYQSSSVMRGHGLVSGSGYLGNLAVPAPYLGTYYGALVPGVSYSTNTALNNTGGLGVTTNGLTYLNTNVPPDNLQQIAYGYYGVNGQSVSAAMPVAFSSAVAKVGGGAGPANGVFAGGGTSTTPGDWDTGVAGNPDGAYVNKADEGSVLVTTNSGGGSITPPYFSAPGLSSYLTSYTFFSPNRMMPSPVMFGSLPTGVIAGKPWQTLLFRPDPGASTQHIGSTSPKDHLMLDLFTMPVVEPYPISDPFSTAGKINMNYQIVPFTYIRRATAVEAVLRSEEMLAIPSSDGPTYKSSTTTPSRRYYIDLDQTLTGFDNMFTTGNTDGTGTAPDIFRSASQICDVWLVPAGLSQTYSGMPNFWWNKASPGTGDYALTGDNIRERPYANIYGRLTTKSNTFTVHYRVQTLKKVATTSASQWVEGTDVSTSEYRGSSTMERYLDTTDTRIPDYATAAQSPPPTSIDNFYKFRVVETKQFNP